MIFLMYSILTIALVSDCTQQNVGKRCANQQVQLLLMKTYCAEIFFLKKFHISVIEAVAGKASHKMTTRHINYDCM